ncbi:MAG TPA: molecular chaperone GroEL, partial [Myxococcales bacterium]|nr:molecular chaperone GroEL [Myxococcales bacterium]
GIVAGGGVAYLRCQPALEKLASTLSADQRLGIDIIRRALERPARRIAENAGWEGAVVIERIRTGSGSFGFNALTETFEDL